MGYFDSGFWSPHFKRVYVAQLRAFERAVIDRLIPAFEGIEEEAERIANEEYERLGSLPGDGSVDMGDLAEAAQDPGIGHYEELSAVRQSLLNLSATALFHLFEQQLLTFHRRQVLDLGEEFDEKLFSRAIILERFRHGGVNLESLNSWKGIRELEALANTVKHGTGRSSRLLGQLRPDLLVYPPFRGQPGFLGTPLTDVHMPLAGDDVFVSENDFRGFANAVVAFWNELADAIARTE
jgi:hypothetical protein